MIDGAVLGGARGNAGELGHTIAVPGGHACVCGKQGCLETYVSVEALRSFLAERGAGRSEMPNLEDPVAAEDPSRGAWIGQAVAPLRDGINTLENLFDPETIMIGGNAPAWLIDALIGTVEPLHESIALHRQRALPRLMRADLGADGRRPRRCDAADPGTAQARFNRSAESPRGVPEAAD